MIRFEVDKYELNNEHSLVAILGAKELTEWQKEQAKKLAVEIDIEKFQKEVIEHRICGLVMPNIQKLNLFELEGCEQISKKAKQQIFDSMKLSGDLVNLSRKFNEKDIRFLLMKGPVLGQSLYGDITKRTSRDLDVLISLKDIDKAVNVLNEMGFQARSSNKYTKKQMEYVYRQEHHFDFWNSEGRGIELHWKMSETLSLTLEDLWENRREVSFVGSRIAIPGKSEELLFLVHHGIGHGFHRTKWLLDIVEFVKQERINWPQIINHACKTKRLNEIFAVILLCYAIDAFDMPLVSTNCFNVYKDEKSVIVEIYKDDEYFVKSLESAKKLVRAMKVLVCYEKENRGLALESQEYITYYHTYIKEMDFFQEKKKIKRFLARFQPTKRDFELLRVNDRLFFIYYLTRPFYWVFLKIKQKEQWKNI